MKVRRINLFGGPGVGKSTTAARIFAHLKIKNVSVELVSEYVKSWAAMKRPIRKYDQLYLFGKQQQYEYRWLSHDIEIIVTDSPTFLSTIYAREYVSNEMADALITLDNLYEEDYPSLNIYLDRGDNDYKQEARYQDEGEARRFDRLIKDGLKTDGVGRRTVFHLYNDLDGIINEIEGVLE